MGIWRLVRKEMGYRRLNFALGVLGVLVATAGLIAQATLLRAYDIRTEAFLARDEQEAGKRLKAVEKAYRQETLKYGFNARVLPEGQSLDDFYATGYASKTMPQKSPLALRTKCHQWVNNGGMPLVLNTISSTGPKVCTARPGQSAMPPGASSM